MSNFTDVGEWMTMFKQEVHKTPTFPSEDIENLRFELIAEELQELSDAMRAEDMVGIADALGDLLYVVYGTGHAYGINLDRVFAEVHRSNMSKAGPHGPIYRADGKVLKGDLYSPPDLREIVYGT